MDQKYSPFTYKKQWNGLGPLTHISHSAQFGTVCDDKCWKQLFYCVTVTSLFQINEQCERESHHKISGIIWIASLLSVHHITEIAGGTAAGHGAETEERLDNKLHFFPYASKVLHYCLLL